MGRKSHGKVSFTMLRQAVLAVLPTARAEVLSDDELAGIVWASVHGLAMLRLNRLGAPIRTGPQQNAKQMGEALVRFCLLAIQGLAVDPADATGPDQPVPAR